MLFDPEHFSKFNSLKPNPTAYPVVGFDSEDNSDGEVISFAFYDGGRYTKHGYYYTTDVNDALNFIMNYPQTAMFVAHNLEYDLNNLFKHNDFKYIDEEIKVPKLVKATLIGSKNFFMNSNAFFNGTLRKMGDVVGCKKLEGDEQDRFNPKYVIRDAEIVYRYMTEFQKSVNEKYNVRIRTTIGSTAMSIYRTNFMDSKHQITYNNPELLHAYYGGRTEIFYKGLINGPIRIPDINSSYPDVMYKNKYPDTGTLEKSSIYTHKFGIGKFTVKVPEDTHIPVLPYKSPEGKLFFPVGKFTGYWTYAEVNYAVLNGTRILKEHDGVGTHRGIEPFKQFVDHFYSGRELNKNEIHRLKDIKNKTEKDLLDLNKHLMESQEKKDLQNNLYGKWCQHKANGILCRRPQTKKQLDFKMKGDYKYHRLGPFHEYTPKEGKPAETANYMWGIHVTSYARIQLHKHLMNVHNAGGTVLYCDTDSIMYAGDIPKNTLDIGSKLGQLEYETTNDGREYFDMALFRQAKGYLICNLTGKTKNGLKELNIVKSACKGVPTEFAYDFILRNMASFDKPMRQREYFISAYAKKSNIRRKIGLNVWDTVEKRMNLEYIKRIGQGLTRPVNVSEIEALEINVHGAIVETYEENLKDFGIWINRKEPKQVFTKVPIPKNWRKHHKHEVQTEKKLKSQRIVLLKTIHFFDLPEDTVWFSGYIEGFISDKFAEYMILTLIQFEGDILTFTSLKAWINVKTFKKLYMLKDIENVVGTLVTVTKIDEDETKIEALKNSETVNFTELKKIRDQKKEEADKKRLNEYLKKKGII